MSIESVMNCAARIICGGFARSVSVNQATSHSSVRNFKHGANATRETAAWLLPQIKLPRFVTANAGRDCNVG